MRTAINRRVRESATHDVGDAVVALRVVQLVPAAALRVLLGVEDEVRVRRPPSVWAREHSNY